LRITNLSIVPLGLVFLAMCVRALDLLCIPLALNAPMLHAHALSFESQRR
jgi:hypothetical protein